MLLGSSPEGAGMSFAGVEPGRVQATGDRQVSWARTVAFDARHLEDRWYVLQVRMTE
jgi:hypothetical protein